MVDLEEDPQYFKKDKHGWYSTRPYNDNEDLSKFPEHCIYTTSSGSTRIKRYVDNPYPKPLGCTWIDILDMTYHKSEVTGYPTQKPESLLERIIQASSNEGDLVFDPFCGCATTLVAAEKLGREWVGIDVSPQSAKEIKERMIKLAVDRGEDELAIWPGIHNRDLCTAKQLDRLERTEWGKLPHPRTHKQRLFGDQKGKCATCPLTPGCGNVEVDHIVPKSKGGTDHKSNPQVLCSGCNLLKGNLSMAWLKKELRKRGELEEE